MEEDKDWKSWVFFALLVGVTLVAGGCEARFESKQPADDPAIHERLDDLERRVEALEQPPRIRSKVQ